MNTTTAPAPDTMDAAVARVRAAGDAREHRTTSIGEQVSRWRDQLPADRRALFDEARLKARDDGYADARSGRDRTNSAEAIAENRARQDAIRARAWARSCPALYADAAIADLLQQQDPDGKVTAWWDSSAQQLLISGPSRHGKTFGAYAVGNQARQAGKWVLAWSAPGLMDAIKPSSTDADANFRHAQTCDLLIIDDLGRDRETDWTRERLYTIVDTRLTSGLRTITTTNEGYFSLVERYGDPIVNRLLDGSVTVKVEGKLLSKPAPF